jgi:hypothetical protein
LTNPKENARAPTFWPRHSDTFFGSPFQKEQKEQRLTFEGRINNMKRHQARPQVHEAIEHEARDP